MIKKGLSFTQEQEETTSKVILAMFVLFDLLKIDLNGTVKVMHTAELKKIKRFIMLSSAFSLDQDKWNKSFLKDIDYPAENSIENVVDTLVQSLQETLTIGKVITMSYGRTPIPEALRDL